MMKFNGRYIRAFDRNISVNYFQMLFYLVLGFALLLGLVCLILYVVQLLAPSQLGPYSFHHLAFLLLTDPGNLGSVLDQNTDETFAVVCALIAILGAVFFGGVLISMMSNFVERRVEAIRTGDIAYKLADHVVLIGHDSLLPELVRQICDCPTFDDAHILIQCEGTVEAVRTELSTLLSSTQERRIVFSNGRRDSLEDLEKLCLPQAMEIYIVGDRLREDHDALNFDCLQKIVQLTGQQDFAHQKNIHLLLENHTTHATLQTVDLAAAWRNSIKVTPLNFYETWARNVLQTYPPLERPTIYAQDSRETVNMVIFGMTRMGTTLAVEAAHLLHFPNLPDGSTRHTRITFVSPDADTEMRLFRMRYSAVFEIQSAIYTDLTTGDHKPQLLPPTYFEGEDADFLDIDFEFIKAPLYDEEVNQMLVQRAASPECCLSVFACTGNETVDLNIGLYLPDSVIRHATVFIQQRHTGQLLNQLNTISAQTTPKGKYANVHPFGMTATDFDVAGRARNVAVLINYYYCHMDNEAIVGNDVLLTESQRGEALHLWEQTSVQNQWSSYYCCHALSYKFRAWGIREVSLDNMEHIRRLATEHVEPIAVMEHNRWNMEKLLHGFRKPHREEQAEIDSCRRQPDAAHSQDAFRCYKSQQSVHDYIRSYDDLSRVRWTGWTPEQNPQFIDIKILSHIPWILRNAASFGAL